MRRLLPEPGGAVTEDGLAAAYSYPPDLPWLRANMVSSVDGAASMGGRSDGLSGAVDRRVLGLLRALADVVVVGAGTVRAEDYGPVRAFSSHAARRAAAGQPPAPVLAVVSARLDLDPRARLFAPAPQRPLVLTTRQAPVERVRALREVADVVAAGEDRVDVPTALDMLAARGLTRVLCEGGPSWLHAVAAAGRLDELCLTLSPKLVGGKAPRLLDGPLEASRLDLRHVLEEDGFLFLRYACQASPRP